MHSGPFTPIGSNSAMLCVVVSTDDYDYDYFHTLYPWSLPSLRVVPVLLSCVSIDIWHPVVRHTSSTGRYRASTATPPTTDTTTTTAATCTLWLGPCSLPSRAIIPILGLSLLREYVVLVHRTNALYIQYLHSISYNYSNNIQCERSINTVLIQ